MNGAEVSKLWMVEYSKGQRAFHVGEVEDSLKSNLNQFLDRGAGDRDFVPLAIVATHDEAIEAVKSLREILEETGGR